MAQQQPSLDLFTEASVPTWSDLPVVGPLDRPLSFLLNRPLQRSGGEAMTSLGSIHTLPDAGPQSLPRANYAPPDALREGLRHRVEQNGVIAQESKERRKRGPKTKYGPVTLVPNLSKKPRGRVVPTADIGVRNGRIHKCPAGNCGKVFARSEHLRRHMASLHTHEKPYRCAQCNRSFARQDNLLQHQRTHQDDYLPFFDCTKDYNGRRMPGTSEVDSEDPSPRSIPETLAFQPAPCLETSAFLGDPAYNFPCQTTQFAPHYICHPPDTSTAEHPAANESFGHGPDCPVSQSEPFGAIGSTALFLPLWFDSF